MSLQVPAAAAAAASIERRKDYAVQLLKTALRYSSDTDVAALTAIIEHQVAVMLSGSFRPGLNDARYHVFRKFWMQGGAK
ncbi:hypothetical protein [Pseudomonas putida]